MGNWEGVFMNDFKVNIVFEINENDHIQGNIKIFGNENLIQDDRITEITLNNEHCEFYIPDKETNFIGIFNKNFTQLSGEFVFPDGSKHVLNVERRNDEAKLDSSSFENFIELKENTLSARELNEDLCFVFEKLKDFHPQLNAYLSEDSLNELFNSLTDKISDGLTRGDFYLLASTLTDAVSCSHTGVRLSEIQQHSIRSFGNFFPLKLFFSSNNVYT